MRQGLVRSNPAASWCKRDRVKMKLFAIAAAAALTAWSAQANTVDFSKNMGLDLGHGAFVDGAFDFGNGVTGTISTTKRVYQNGQLVYVDGTAQVFDSSIPLSQKTEDPDLQTPKDIKTGIRSSDLGNVLIINEDPNRVDDHWKGGEITFMFDKIVEFWGVTLVDLEEKQPVTILADNFQSLPKYNKDNYFSEFLKQSPILTKTLTFRFGGSGAIDNLQVTAPVPLPASALLLVGGLGALGAMRRRKKAAKA